MYLARIALLAVCALAAGQTVAPAAMVRTQPSAMAAERARTDADYRALQASVKRTKTFCARARGPIQRCECLQQLKRRQAEVTRAKQNASDILETVMLVMKESIKDTNENKKYFLQKLQMFNKMGEELSDYLADLTRHSTELGSRRAGSGRPLSEGQCRGMDTMRAIGPVSDRTRRPPARGMVARPGNIRSLAEHGTDRPGADYRAFDPPKADPAQCRNACAKDPRCKAWTYMKPGVRGSGPHCWLKSRVPALRPDPCCTSGVK